MNRIKLLPENLINQIAAGEVIERPASVVKELVENSIDAGALRIEAEISNEGRNIRVSDNGSGIHKDDIVLAFSRHATSKITKENDLWGISTLGFRGEALASIISVAKVSCTTKTKDSETGVRVECQDSEVKTSPAGCAVGTIMEVKDLFYNTPVRLKFLKKSQTEYSNIIEVMQGIAISNPSVAINLIHKGNSSLKTTGSGDFGIAISEVYSKDLIRELAKVSKEDKTEGIKIQGYTSNPDFTRSNKKAIYTFVNGRNVKCPVLIKAVDTAFKDFIPSGRYPFVVLNLVIQGEQVDVNVHPSKRELRYTNPNLVFNFTYSSIRSALENTPSQAKIYPVRPVFKETNSFEPAVFSGQNSKYEAKTHALAPDSVNFSEMREQIEKSIDFYKPEQKRITDLEFEEKNAEKPKIIGQYLNTYILLETSEGLTIIDQHIAHERTLYDRLKSSKEVASQLLLTSDVIELEPSDVSLLLESRETLEKYGYCIEPVSEREIIFKQVPQMLAGKHPEKIINELIEAVKSSIDSIEDNILASTACHASVKAGEKLSIWQMEELVINWQKTIFPKTCPHGRKICHLIPIKELAGFFGRFED